MVNITACSFISFLISFKGWDKSPKPIFSAKPAIPLIAFPVKPVALLMFFWALTVASKDLLNFSWWPTFSSKVCASSLANANNSWASVNSLPVNFPDFIWFWRDFVSLVNLWNSKLTFDCSDLVCLTDDFVRSYCMSDNSSAKFRIFLKPLDIFFKGLSILPNSLAISLNDSFTPSSPVFISRISALIPFILVSTVLVAAATLP